jgi:hypothetical protein
VLGAQMRFRAVMMTSFAFIFGVYPLVGAQGAAEISRHDVGTPVFADDRRKRDRTIRNPDTLCHLSEPAREQQRAPPTFQRREEGGALTLIALGDLAWGTTDLTIQYPDRFVPAPPTLQFFQGLQKPVPIVPSDLIFHGHQHWPSIGLDVRYQHGSGPVHGRREVEIRTLRPACPCPRRVPPQRLIEPCYRFSNATSGQLLDVAAREADSGER